MPGLVGGIIVIAVIVLVILASCIKIVLIDIFRLL